MVTLDEIKKHLNIEGFNDDDEYILSLVEVSIDALSKHLNRDLRNETTPPEALKHAVKLMVGQLYAHREATTSEAVNSIPYTLDYLISIYRNYSNIEIV